MSTQVTEQTTQPEKQSFKNKTNPIWCPGCGDYGVLNALTGALSDLGLATSEVAVVTGASSGIGRASAIGLAKAGFKVAILGRRQAEIDATAEAAGASASSAARGPGRPHRDGGRGRRDGSGRRRSSDCALCRYGRPAP